MASGFDPVRITQATYDAEPWVGSSGKTGGSPWFVTLRRSRNSMAYTMFAVVSCMEVVAALRGRRHHDIV